MAGATTSIVFMVFIVFSVRASDGIFYMLTCIVEKLTLKLERKQYNIIADSIHRNLI